MQKDNFKSEIENITKQLHVLKDENSKRINWAKDLGFFTEKHPKNSDVRRLAEIFTETDNYPRLTWDSDFKIISVNRPFLNQLGYDESDLIGQYIIDSKGNSKFIASEYIKASIEVVTNNVKGGVEMMEGIENKWYAKNGTEVSVEWFKGFNDTESGIGSTQCQFKLKEAI